MTIDKHVYFSNDILNRIKDYSDKNKITFSKAVCNLVSIALDNIGLNDRIYQLQKDMSFCINKENQIFLLLKQLYSDLDFENITDPNKSKAVNEFMKKIKGSKYND